MNEVCTTSECTVLQTGKCLLNHNPDACPNRFAAAKDTAEVGLAPVLLAPSVNARLDSSLTLTPEKTGLLASARLCTQIGMLGFPNSGKTAALVSLYLLVSKGKLSGFQFRDSKTLMALEQISRGARWHDTHYPQQLTAHTEIADGRAAGFLHFRLFNESENKCLDLLIPDIPGEWTDALASENRIDRLHFLRGSQVIWLFVDGRVLGSFEQRNLLIHRLETVVKRLAAFFGELSKPPISFVVTRRDQVEPHGPSVQKLVNFAKNFGFESDSVSVASFSENQSQIQPGTGLSELISSLHDSSAPKIGAWVDSARRNGARSILNFRGA
jgi:hypothetical protein